MKRLKPTNKWTRYPNSAVYENEHGDRLHLGGLLRKKCGEVINLNTGKEWGKGYHKLAHAMQPHSRRRCLMVWAELHLA